MRIVIAADKFKHSLSSFAVCAAIRDGLLLASPEFSVTSLPLSDGGDGLAAVLAHYHPFETLVATVNDPLCRPVVATWLFAASDHVAVVEMAQASGLHRLQPADYNCAATTTYGTGELIKKALAKGARKIILGIGGSATNDCGMGLAAALGYCFLDKYGRELAPTGQSLQAVHTIVVPEKKAWQECELQVACDVSNYLTGAAGATRVYGPQKGASPQQVEELEAGMLHFAGVVKSGLGVDLTRIGGGGAAGGTGAGCVAFLQATMVSGAALALAYSRAAEQIQKADLVITGEGRLDNQTWNGKLVDAVTQLCAAHGKPVIALCGTLDLTPAEVKANGLTAAFSLCNGPITLDTALLKAPELLSQAAFAVGSLLQACGFAGRNSDPGRPVSLPG